MKRFFMFGIKSLALMVYFISHCFIRKKNRWIFGEPHGFNNNSKYFFLDVIENHTEIDAMWVGDKETVDNLLKKGLPAYSRYSIKGIWYCLTAKVYVVSWTTGDINFYLSGGALILNLWHGTPLKKCLWLEPQNIKVDNSGILTRFVHHVEAPISYYGNLFVQPPSEFYAGIFMDMFRVCKDKCIIDIYPRNKFLTKDKKDIKSFLKRYSYTEELNLIHSIEKYDKVMIYAPTFRDNGKDFIDASGLDFFKLDELLADKNYCMIVKFHPATKYDASKFSSLRNIRFLSNKYDTYILMPFTDLMISDYSSIIFDYTLLNKKVIAFAFDYDQYISECRELLFDMREALDGVTFAHSAEELVNLIFLSEEKLGIMSDALYKRYWSPSENLFDSIQSKVNM